MNVLPQLFLLILGAVVGSFLNVCIHRLPREESVVSPPSHCPGCGTPVKPYDNIPILSYFILRGRCRSCGARISLRYVIVEIITALSFLYLAHLYAGSLPMLLIGLVFVCGLIVVFFADLEHQIIPDEISLGGIPFAVLASVAYPPVHAVLSRQEALIRSLTGLAAGGGIFWFIRIAGGRVFKKEAMGFGDVKLVAAIGALLGPLLALLTTFLAAVIGSLVGLSLIAAGRAQLTSKLPFGPFICIAAAISFLYGNGFVNWYISLFR